MWLCTILATTISNQRKNLDKFVSGEIIAISKPKMFELSTFIQKTILQPVKIHARYCYGFQNFQLESVLFQPFESYHLSAQRIIMFIALS